MISSVYFFPRIRIHAFVNQKKTQKKGIQSYTPKKGIQTYQARYIQVKYAKTFDMTRLKAISEPNPCPFAIKSWKIYLG